MILCVMRYGSAHRVRKRTKLNRLVQAAFIVAEAVTHAASGPSSVFSTFAFFASSSALLSPTAAYELAFTYLSEYFASSAFYLLYLLQLLGLENVHEQHSDASFETRPSKLFQLAEKLLPSGVNLPAPEASASFDPHAFEREFIYLSNGEAWGNFGNILFEKEADNWYQQHPPASSTPI